MKFMTRLGTLFLIGVAIMMVPSIGMATITFHGSDTPGVNVFQQTTNNPCVIGDPACKQPTTGGPSGAMFYDSNSGSPCGGGSCTYDLFSTVYVAASPNDFTKQQIPVSFTIGIDDNFTTNHEFLIAFNTYTCTGPVSTANNSNQTTKPAGCTTGTLDASNSFNSSTAGYSVHDVSQFSNGNGFSNAILQGFSLSPGTFYLFEAIVSADNDGMEEFFMIPSGNPPTFIPEPASIFMLGTTLIGLGALARRRWQRAKR